MCTYNISLNDTLIEQVRPAFPSQEAITAWMQQQVERMLRQIAVKTAPSVAPRTKVVVNERIKALSNVPTTTEDVDYKNSLLDVMSSKYDL